MDFYPDGAWLVELAPLADEALLPQVVLSALGASEAPGRRPLDSLTDYLRSKSLLLLLDNCEHLVEACARAGGVAALAVPPIAHPGHEPGDAWGGGGGAVASAVAVPARGRPPRWTVWPSARRWAVCGAGPGG